MNYLLGQHLVSNKSQVTCELALGESRIVMTPNSSRSHSLYYRRYESARQIASQFIVTSDENTHVVGVFPSPPLYTPKRIASSVYLKFKSPVIVPQNSDVVVYATMPIEIAVYSQSKDEELLLDAFALKRPRFALYGSPEAGVLCRYDKVDVKANKEEVRPARYKEALIRIAIRNEIDNIVRVNKVIIPVGNIVLDHANDDSWLPGTVEMSLNQTFGKDVIKLNLVDTKVKSTDKTSIARKEDSIVFLMDAGY